MTQTTKLKQGHTKIDPQTLHESPMNPRRISADRFTALKHALQEDPDMLEARPLIVTPQGEVVCGNMRLRAIRELGWDAVNVYVADLDDATKREWMIRDNNEYGEWVPDELAALVADHRDSERDLAMLGFSQGELDDLLKLATQELPEPGDEPSVDPPDVWGVVVECQTEEQQVQLLERLAGEGFQCRALLA